MWTWRQGWDKDGEGDGEKADTCINSKRKEKQV